MAQISARGAASVTSLGDYGGGGMAGFNLSTPAGWHLTFWGASVLLILFFLWAL